jgi:disulfide bond formation protein DsbB
MGAPKARAKAAHGSVKGNGRSGLEVPPLDRDPRARSSRGAPSLTYLTRRNLVLAATLGSAAMLLAAWGFQYLGGLAPCALCYWQRYPYMAAVPVGLLALAIPGIALPLLGAATAAATSAVGLYHTGVERGWWQGPDTCTAGPVGGLSPDQLLDQIMAAPSSAATRSPGSSSAFRWPPGTPSRRSAS